MGNQLIILGCVGSFNPQLTADLVKFLSERGMQIQHASNRYQGQTHFAVGTGADLAAAFEEAEIKTAFVEITSTAETTVEPITLQTVLDAVNEARKEAAGFFRYERKDDKKRGKKNEEGGGAGKVTPEPENAQPQVSIDPAAPDAATAQAGGSEAIAETTQEPDGNPETPAPETETPIPEGTPEA